LVATKERSMNWLYFSFDQPAWLLLLLVLLPLVWFTGWKSLSGLGRWRFWTALAFRSALLVLLVCALAEIQLVRISQRIVTLFLVDQSASIDPQGRQAAFDYVNAAVAKYRDPKVQDAAGLIVFGAEAQIEHAPSTFGPMPHKLESTLDDGRTNLAGGMRLAKASFPADAAKRVVLLSDGNQNVGDALAEARDLASSGIGIDVVPLAHGAPGDIVVERVTAPAGVRVGTVFDVQVLIDYRLPPANEFRPAAADEVAGRLTIFRKAAGHSELVGEQDVTLRPGKQMFQFRQQLTEAAFYTYEARFVPADKKHDHYSQNNTATAFTHLQGRGRVLLIVNAEQPNEFDNLASLLRKHELEVTVQPTSALFTTLAELQDYDCVVLANVPRTTSSLTGTATQFTDEQISLLVKNVEQLGAGLVMLGGIDSFGAGDWANTELEKALPVDLQIKNSKVMASTALMLVIDKSGSMAGQKLELTKGSAVAAVNLLSPLDSIGVIAFDDGHNEVVSLQKIEGKSHQIKNRIMQIGSGGGTNMETAVKRGYDRLLKSRAAVKHMIILTDGQTAGTGYQNLASDMRKRNITTTTVAVGNDAAKGLLQEIALRGGGKFYLATNPRILPGIFTRETRRVARPLIYESDAPMPLIRNQQHEILTGISADLPPITGYILTTLKENPLVEAPLLAPQPGSPNNTVLAAWTYGLGRTVAFTTDSGQRWAKHWNDSADKEKLFVQMIRWSMRPLLDQGNFTVNTLVRDGELEVNVQALTKDGDFINNLPMTATITGDDNSTKGELLLEQTGPGRYRGRVPLPYAGTYLLGIQPGPGMGMLRTGVNVPSSAEYRDVTANEELLLSLASLKPDGGKHGEVIRLPEDPRQWGQFPGPDVFRRDLAPGRALTGVWPTVVLIGACLFFFDVFNRRVQIPWDAFQAYFARLFKRQTVPEVAHPLDRLQATKRMIRESTTSSRHWTPPEVDAPPLNAGPESLVSEPQTQPVVAETTPAEPEEDYSQRLLKRLREIRSKDKGRQSD
jgi:Mg-chelatase subunit ChlD